MVYFRNIYASLFPSLVGNFHLVVVLADFVHTANVTDDSMAILPTWVRLTAKLVINLTIL